MAPAASVPPQVESGDSVKSPALAPVNDTALAPVTGMVPVFFRLKEYEAPAAHTFPKAWFGSGAEAAVFWICADSTPVPDNVVFSVPPLLVTVRLALRAPAAVGAKATSIMQVP